MREREKSHCTRETFLSIRFRDARMNASRSGRARVVDPRIDER